MVSIFTPEADIIEAGGRYLRILALSFPLFAISQVLFSALRSVENTKIGLHIAMVTLVLNISLNAVLIFGLFGVPAMGFVGAAFATLAARLVETVLVICYILRKEHTLKMRLCHLLAFDPKLMKTFLKYGIPVFIGELVWGFNTLMRSYFIGQFSVETVTAFSMINLLSQTVFIWILALEAAVGILTGKLIGMSKKDEIRPYTYSMQIVFLFLGVIAVIFLFILRAPLLSLYDVSSEAKHIAYSLSNVMIPVVFFSVYEDMTLCGIIQCGGETAFVLTVDALFVFLLMFPSCILALRS